MGTRSFSVTRESQHVPISWASGATGFSCRPTCYIGASPTTQLHNYTTTQLHNYRILDYWTHCGGEMCESQVPSRLKDARIAMAT
jgi:hypothetical protein